MKPHEVEELLLTIQSIDRKPFPPNAPMTWYEILRDVAYIDAKQAVHEHYTSLGARDGRGDVRPILPVDIRSRASALAEHRARSMARNALPGPRERRGSIGRPAEVEAELAAARARVAEALARHERVSVAA
jgi:hypothetical protein